MVGIMAITGWWCAAAIAGLPWVPAFHTYVSVRCYLMVHCYHSSWIFSSLFASVWGYVSVL